MRRAVVAALVATLALAACGGGVSKADFVEKADPACGPGNATISGVAKPSNAAQVAAAAGTATTTIDAQVAALRALDLPSSGDDKRQAEGVITAIGEVGAPTKALQDAAGRNDEPAMAKAAVDMQAKADAAAGQAQAYGMAQCGTGLEPALANLFEGTRSTLKTTYITRGEALCRDASRRMSAVPATGTSLAATVRRLDGIVVIMTKLITDLRALPAPPGDQATVDDFLAAFESFNAKAKELSAAGKANNPNMVLAIEKEFQASAETLTTKLTAYGLPSCSGTD